MRELGDLSNKYLARKISNFVKDDILELRKKRVLRRCVDEEFHHLKGLYDLNDRVTISPLQTEEEQAITVIHEYLHFMYSKAQELEVEEKAINIYRSLTEPQRDFLIAILSSL